MTATAPIDFEAKLIRTDDGSTDRTPVRVAIGETYTQAAGTTKYYRINTANLKADPTLHGKSLPIYGDGKNIRDWLYVEDHCKGIDMVQEKGRLFETYNIGGHNERENIQIVKTIIATLREELSDDDPRKAHVNEDLITYVTDRKGHDRRYAIAPDKIKAEVGWYPETTFEVGIKKTIKWYFEHAEWMEHVTSGNYQKYYEDMYSGK